MNITIEELRFAVKQCTPGAPDSYADRLWAALTQVCECDAGGNVPHEQHRGRHGSFSELYPHADRAGGIPGQPFGGSVYR